MKKLVTLAIIGLLWNHNIIAQNIGDNHKDLKEVDLILQADKIKIGGTLTLPATFNTSSLVILSSGSGPQDRGETLDGFKIFKVIADHLATKGIASFRYDDRGVGSSTGDFVNSTIEDHSKDLEHIINYFKFSEAHPFNEFILFGHSQGGILSAKVAAQNESVKKLVLMAAPAVPLIEIVTYQIRQEYSQTNISKSLIEADVSAHNRLMRAIADDKTIEEAYKLFRQTTETILYEMNSKSKTDSTKIKQKAITKADEFKIIYKLPSLTSFLYYDPFEDLENLSIPVLSLFGGLDFQVPIELNKDRMENALLKSRTKYDFVTFDKANHYFQEAKTGEREEYAALEKNFVPNFLNQISEWILKSK
ncbi:alpha/beta hydrolase [Winogradskyella sp. SYSU M77433]|uniref:alpha/beta hydrolase family protein n=1 Tax=Winogradskyella sp. SYSU M77433 TaxID=3042722 RepID=UPI002480395E|nr:alpha/beta hydrolase [Winogradskyella sp. SYSU M77433]MDH7912777.1 alpha/beta hydrolase [Winogradskyella sp. SYSU M77433]